MNSSIRSYGIQKIYELHAEKEYRNETLFTACNIFDRYLGTVRPENFPNKHICRLSTISILLAAKMEESIQPSFDMMIDLLTEKEQQSLSQSKLKKLEKDILVRLGFNLNYVGPVEYISRYLQILKFDQIDLVRDYSYEICKYLSNDS